MKKRHKKIVFLTIVTLLFSTISAATLVSSSNVTLSSTETTKKNLSDAVDELYTKKEQKLQKAKASCPEGYECNKSYTKTGSNGWTGIYTCKNGTATITGCSYKGTVCNGGSSGSNAAAILMCTLSTSGSTSPYTMCNNSLDKTYVYGGGLPETESCS